MAEPMDDVEAVAKIIEASLVRHGVDLADCEGTLDDAEQAIAALSPRLSAAKEEGIREERDRCAKIAENPGFIQARDTDWDEGVNYAKRLIARAIRKEPSQ